MPLITDVALAAAVIGTATWNWWSRRRDRAHIASLNTAVTRLSAILTRAERDRAGADLAAHPEIPPTNGHHPPTSHRRSTRTGITLFGLSLGAIVTAAGAWMRETVGAPAVVIPAAGAVLVGGTLLLHADMPADIPPSERDTPPSSTAPPSAPAPASDQDGGADGGEDHHAPEPESTSEPELPEPVEAELPDDVSESETPAEPGGQAPDSSGSGSSDDSPGGGPPSEVGPPDDVPGQQPDDAGPDRGQGDPNQGRVDPPENANPGPPDTPPGQRKLLCADVEAVVHLDLCLG